MKIYDYYTLKDIKLCNRTESISFFDAAPEDVSCEGLEKISVCKPDSEFGFLHEAAITEFKGVLYASWYHNGGTELEGYTPVCGKRSYDKGRTWSEREVIAADLSGKIIYCPPVYCANDGRLYMFINEMVGADLIHSLDLYVLNEQTGKFDFLWSRPIPFKINTNAVMLPNGKLIIPGRIAEPDGFPNTPAVLISDSGKADAEWRVVKLAENGDLPNGESYMHPELTVAVSNDKIYAFNRYDRGYASVAYISEDFGESWSDVKNHDISYICSKIYAGELSDGRHYLVANEHSIEGYRFRLVVYFTDGADMVFKKRLVLTDYPFEVKAGEPNACHYPSVCEYDGKLYIIASEDYEGGGRGAVLFIVKLDGLTK